MDTISVIKVGATAAEETLSFLINNRDLTDRIFEHGGIALGIPMRVIVEERRFTVFSEECAPTPTRLAVLASEHGWSGVTATTALVSYSEQTVTWSELAPAWRRRLTRIPQLGPFTFARPQYEAAMALGRRWAEEWRVLFAGSFGSRSPSL